MQWLDRKTRLLLVHGHHHYIRSVYIIVESGWESI